MVELTMAEATTALRCVRLLLREFPRVGPRMAAAGLELGAVASLASRLAGELDAERRRRLAGESDEGQDEGVAGLRS